MSQEHWVIDNEKTRSYHGKTLMIQGKGVFLMRVRDTNDKGEKRPGYVQLLITPHDLNAAMSTLKGEVSDGPMNLIRPKNN